MHSIVYSLLSIGISNTDICHATGIDPKELCNFDFERLKELYTLQTIESNESTTNVVMQTNDPAPFLGIHQFECSNDHSPATAIIDAKKGHILWLEQDEIKTVVAHFIDHVGEIWMKKVEAIACDSTSDLPQSLKTTYSHIRLVFDSFHLLQKYNSCVVAPIQKSAPKASHTPPPAKQPSTYHSLLSENEPLMAIDLILEKLKYAFKSSQEEQLASEIIAISEICQGTQNPHFDAFSTLLQKHLKAITANTPFHFAANQLEKLHQKITLIQNQTSNYHNNKYLLLKIFDASRTNPPQTLTSFRSEE